MSDATPFVLTNVTDCLERAAVWLSESPPDHLGSRIGYAAFELRLAIEGLALHYWTELLPQPLKEDYRDLSFKKMERRIYQLAGHQREIDGQFEFTRVLLRLLKIDYNLATPNVGELSKWWHTCSMLCHIGWTIVGNEPELCRVVKAELEEIAAALRRLVAGTSGWPKIIDAEFVELRRRFVLGEADKASVARLVEQRGMWARVDSAGGRPATFLGTPVPPSPSGTES